jgi:hypothetical protein
VFHDTTEAVAASWDRDRQTMDASGYRVVPLRERAGFVQATVSLSSESLLVEWMHDSAYRFFPLVEDDDLGLTMHPFDLAINKVLALVGRLEVRDWIDVLACDAQLQPFGYLVWAACGKDPGFSPQALLGHARRTTHYAADEVASLAFDGAPPDVAALSQQWRRSLEEGAAIVAALPAEHIGTVVLTAAGDLARADASGLRDTVNRGALRFHPGRVGGAWPTIKV